MNSSLQPLALSGGPRWAASRTLLWMTLVLSFSALQAAPIVSNLTAAQRAGTKLVDISYDLAAPGFGSVAVTLEASSDGGATWTVPVASATGAVGGSVTPGTGKAIVWNAGVDWLGNYSTQMRFRVVAEGGFSYIPGGSFAMGRTSGDTDADVPPITVTVSPFYMQQTETTKAQWDEVRTWALNNGYTDLAVGAGKALNHPVQTVRWWDVVKWCNARSEKEGLTPVYTVSGAVMRTGTTEPLANWSANGYRLPTEAEWEKAARGGVSGKRFPWGTDTISHAQANFRNNGGETYATGTTDFHPSYTTDGTPYTSPVRSFGANGYGLYDMSGNVWEWCWDWYDSSYYTTSNGTTDPRGPASGSLRVRRGGGWNDRAIGARCALRHFSTPGSPNINYGFRPVRSSLPTGSAETSDLTVDARDVPSVTTPTATSITANSAILGGTVVSVGGGRVLERGLIYSEVATNAAPELGGIGVNKLLRSRLLRRGSVGAFTGAVAGLSPATTYAYRAYMKTSVGTSYSEVGYFTTNTPLTFTAGIGTLAGRVIRPGESQLFTFDLADSSLASFSSQGASGTQAWEVSKAGFDSRGKPIWTVIGSGTGDAAFANPLTNGSYSLRLTNNGASTDTVSLNLDGSNLADPRPDISGGSSAAGAEDFGADIYDPTVQEVIQSTSEAKAREYYFLLGNDGPVPDAMKVSATITGRQDPFQTMYKVGIKNVTAAIRLGTYTTPVLSSSDAPVLLFCRVSPNRSDSRIHQKVLNEKGKLVSQYRNEMFNGFVRSTAATDSTINDSIEVRLSALSN